MCEWRKTAVPPTWGKILPARSMAESGRGKNERSGCRNYTRDGQGLRFEVLGPGPFEPDVRLRPAHCRRKRVRKLREGKPTSPASVERDTGTGNGPWNCS